MVNEYNNVLQHINYHLNTNNRDFKRH